MALIYNHGGVIGLKLWKFTCAALTFGLLAAGLSETGASATVQLWLSVIAYSLGNLWRPLALAARVDSWSLTSLQQRLVKTGGRLIKHARYYWLLLAEGHLTRRLFAGMLRKIAALPALVG
jgi:hypothetical protein